MNVEWRFNNVVYVVIPAPNNCQLTNITRHARVPFPEAQPAVPGGVDYQAFLRSLQALENYTWSIPEAFKCTKTVLSVESIEELSGVTYRTWPHGDAYIRFKSYSSTFDGVIRKILVHSSVPGETDDIITEPYLVVHVFQELRGGARAGSDYHPTRFYCNSVHIPPIMIKPSDVVSHISVLLYTSRCACVVPLERVRFMIGRITPTLTRAHNL